MAVVKSPKNTGRKNAYIKVKGNLISKNMQCSKCYYKNYNFSWKSIKNKVNKHAAKLNVSHMYINMFSCY